MQTIKVTTYEPDNSIKKGYLNLFREIFRELRENRWLTSQMFKRDFIATYKQSIIGVLWAVIIPVITVGTFIALNSSGVFDMGKTAVPYPIYAVAGMVFWQLFATGLITSSNSLVKAGSLIVKINFSKKSLVIAAAMQALVSFSVQLLLLFIMLVLYRIPPKITFLLIPVLILPLSLLTLGSGFIFSLLNGVIRDIGNILSVFITFLMFLTPILYPKPETGFLVRITAYNPLYYLVSFPRDLVLIGHSPEFLGFMVSSAFSLLFFLVCLVAFHLTETRVTERI